MTMAHCERCGDPVPVQGRFTRNLTSERRAICESCVIEEREERRGNYETLERRLDEGLPRDLSDLI